MNLTKTHKIIISAVVVIVLFIGFVLWSKNKSKTENTDNKVSTTTFSGDNILGTGATGKYTLEEVPINDNKSSKEPVPDLNRPVTQSVGVVITPEALSYSALKIKTLQERLKKDPKDVLAWIDLGIYQKSAGDYGGAVISWKYAGKLSPADYVSRGNLGNLYAYYIKNNAQAEIYYKEAIKVGPTQSYLYLQLAEVYRDIFKDNSKALATIEQGLLKIPNDQSLIQFKANLGKI